MVNRRFMEYTEKTTAPVVSRQAFLVLRRLQFVIRLKFPSVSLTVDT